MPLKGHKPENEIIPKAVETFERLNKSKNFDRLEKTTEVLAVRLPKGEKNRLRLLFARNGQTLSAGIKAAIYDYAKKLS